jgi:type VI secretion system Hcp family effector
VNKLSIAALSFVAAATVALPAAAADTVYVQVTGASQGGFAGDPARGMLLEHFDLSGTAPVDAASGAAAGRRRWNPIKFTKVLDKASAQFFRAFATGERLSTVTFTIYGPSRNADGSASMGAQQALYTIKLTDAVISSDQIIAPTDKDPATGGGYAQAVENVTVTFQKITVSWSGGSTNSDTWQ